MVAEWTRRFGWRLMGVPTGFRTPNRWVMRYGPYRFGAWLTNRPARPAPKGSSNGC